MIDNINSENILQHKLNFKKICLIDDDDMQHWLNVRIIHSIDKTIEIFSYSSAEIALNDLMVNKIIPDVILLDINMPLMDGWDFIEEVGAREINIPIYMLTSSIDKSDNEKAKKYKVVKGFLNKPLKQEKLESILYSNN
jgi:CheY-like chemotaxis protein